MDETYVNNLAAALRKIGTIHAVGEEWHAYSGEIPAGGVPYSGQTVSRETYAALWQYAQDKGLVKTEAEWQTLSASGNVKFYSDGDGATTFRMPKVTNDAMNGVFAFGVITNVDGIDVGALDASLQALATNVGTLTTDVGALTTSVGEKLPLAGGTMTGGIRFENGTEIYPLDTADWNTLEVSGNGANLHLRGTQSPYYPNSFGVTVDNGSTQKQLYGSIDGSLQWDSKNIVRSINGTTADASGNIELDIGGGATGSNFARYDDGIQMCWGITETGDTNTITFPQAYVSTPSALVTNSGTNTSWTYRIESINTTTLKVTSTSSSRVPYHYFVIGRWK